MTTEQEASERSGRGADAETFDCRVAFAEELVRLAQLDERIVVVCNDSVGSSNLLGFARSFPERLVNVGIAEQNMVGVAAGLANAGLVPLVCSAAPFLSARALEQIKVDLAYSRAHVVCCAMSPGVAYGALGPTHHAIEDLAWFRAIADLAILVPADPGETQRALRWALSVEGPSVIRVARTPVPMVMSDERASVTEAAQLRPGSDVTLIAIGTMVARALHAAEELSREQIAARVLAVTALRPLDHAAIDKAALETAAIVTVEEASVVGGLGSAVAERVVQHCPVPMRLLGIPGVFAPTGSAAFLLEHFNLSSAAIADAGRELVREKAAPRSSGTHGALSTRGLDAGGEA